MGRFVNLIGVHALEAQHTNLAVKISSPHLAELETHELQQLGLQQLAGEGEPVRFLQSFHGAGLADLHWKGDQRLRAGHHHVGPAGGKHIVRQVHPAQDLHPFFL